MKDHVVDADRYISQSHYLFFQIICNFLFLDWGETQDGCATDECSHYYAVKVYISMINGANYPSYTCETVEEIKT